MFPLSIGTYVKFSIGIILLLGCFYGYVEHNRFEAFKLETKTIAKEQEQKNQSIRTQQELINKATKETYEAKLSAIRSYYGGMHNPSSGSMPSLSNPSAGTNASSSQLILDCAISTQQVLSLQDWIKQQSGL